MCNLLIEESVRPLTVQAKKGGMTLMNLLSAAVKAGRSALNEYEAKRFLAEFGIPVSREIYAADDAAAIEAAGEIGLPVVLKAAGEKIQHKTELGAVALNLKSEAEIRVEARRLLAIAGCEGLLVQEMVRGERELVCGLTRDARFGPCVMFGLGGIFTEVFDDAVFRVAPLTTNDALAMMEEIRSAKILRAFRGQAPVERAALARIIVAVGEIGSRHDDVREIDINPVKIRPDGTPVAVDALVTIRATAAAG
jgi:acetate---CoA ligase (ADP-forming) subunit beta